MDLEELIALAKRNPVIVVWLALMLFGAIVRKIAGKKEEGGAQGGRGSAAPRAAPTDLEERIRRNFEEMLRRRATGGEATASAPQPAAAAMAPRNPAPKAKRNYDEQAPREPKQVRVVRKEPTRVRHAPAEATRGDSPIRRRPKLTAPRMLARQSASGAEAAKGAPVVRITRSSVTRRVLRDRAALRRAIVLKEVLGPPRSLGDD